MAGPLTDADFDPPKGDLTPSHFDKPKGTMSESDFDPPVPSARDQFVKSAGKLLAHARLVAQNAASDLLDPVGRSLSDLSEKEGLKADLPIEAMGAASKTAGYKANLAEIALDPIRHSQDIVERLTKAAHESAIQFGIKPSEEEKVQNPNLAALGPLPMKAMRAFQALIDTSLPEVQALGKWIAVKQLPLTDRLNSVIEHSKKKTAFDAASIAPVETTDHEIPKFDLALRTAYEVPNQLLHGALEMGVSMVNPVTAAEAELMGKAGGLMAKGAGEVVARTMPEAGLRVMLSDVSKLGESSTARLTKKKLYTVDGLDGGPVLKSDWSNMDHVHEHVANQTNAALEGVQERTGASPQAMEAAAKAADRAGYEAVFRHLTGLKERGVPINLGPREAPGMRYDGTDAPAPRLLGMDGARGEGFTVDANAPQGPMRRVYDPARAAEDVVPAKTIPIDPQDIATQTIGAGALNPVAAKVARDYPSLYAVSMGAEVPQAVRVELAEVKAELVQRGVTPGPLVDMLKEGVETGKASFVRLSRLNDALFMASLTEQGAHPDTLQRHAADAYTAAQRPGETLVAHGMEVEAQKAAVMARAKASEDVWAEADRESREMESARAPKPAAAPAPAEAPQEPAAPLPDRAEGMAQAVEAGVPLDEAAQAHRDQALAEQEAGTLDPAIAAQYAAAGDDSFDPSALEAMNQAFPNLAKHPGEMTWEEFQAEYPGMEKDTHQSIIDDFKHEIESAARSERADMMESAGLSAQPAHDLLRAMPVGDEWIAKLGLGGEFAASKGKGITAKGGIKVDYAVGRLIEAGLLPEGSSVNDMLDLLDHEARKGSKAEASASMVREGETEDQGGPSSSSRGQAVPRSSSDISVDEKIADVKARADDWLGKEAKGCGAVLDDSFRLQFATYVHFRSNEIMREMNAEMMALPAADRPKWMNESASDERYKEGDALHKKAASLKEAYPEIAAKIPKGDRAAEEKILEGFKPFKAEEGGDSSIVKDDGDAKVFTPAFKKWFGKSKVVGEDGQPLLLAHGTSDDFTTFQTPAFFADKEVAVTYAEERGYKGGANVKQVYLSIKNPATEADVEAAAKKAGVFDDNATYTYLSPAFEDSWKKVVPILKAQGFDGARIDDDYSMDDPFSPVQSWVIFDANQVKSAFNKNPTKGESIVEDSGTNPVQAILDRYEDGADNLTERDVVDEVENAVENDELPGNTDILAQAIETYRQEQADDAELGGRGDMDSAYEAFEGAVKSYLRASSGSMVEDAGFDDGAQGFLFDEKGTVNPDAIAPKEEKAVVLPESKPKQVVGVDGPILVSFAGKTYPVESLAKASELWDKVREGSQTEGLGSRDLSADPLIVDADGKTLGYISYNGRTWKGEPRDAARVEWLDGPAKPAKEGALPLEAEATGERKALIESKPWEMTAEEFAKNHGGSITRSGKDMYFVPNDGQRTLWAGTASKADVLRKQHRFEVVRAIRDGKNVPPEVQAEYPDLATEFAKAKPTAKASGGEITDVGQELWYNRRNLVSKGLKWDDIKGMNATLKALEVTKTKVWPRPDYEDLVASGMNPLTAHLVKQVYDSISTKPSVSGVATDAQMEAYVNEVARIKEAVFTWAKDINAQKGMLDNLMENAKARMSGQFVSILSMRDTPTEGLIDALYPKNAEGQRWGSRNQAQNDLVRLVGGNKFADSLQINMESARTALKAINKGWPAPQEAWEKRFEVREVPAGTKQWSREKGAHTTDKAHFEIKVLASRGMMVRGEFATREEAIARAKELAAKKPDTRRQAEAALTEFVRKGPPQRPGGLDVTPKALQDKFGFRGVNFGNYTDQGERQVFLNNAYDSFLDLADMLGLPASAMSLNGTMGIAFGAQGRGGKYAAHFVPGVNEMNLTKNAGAGSIAHEFFHALDHYFAVQAGEAGAKATDPWLTHLIERGMWDMKNSTLRPMGGLAGLRQEIRQAFLDIVESMKKVQETPEQVAARIESYKAIAGKRLESWLKYFRDRFEASMSSAVEGNAKKVKENNLKQFDLIADALRRGDLGTGWEQIGRGQMSAVRTNVGELRRLYKDVTGHVPSPDDVKSLDSAASSVKMRSDAKTAMEDQKPQSTESQYSKSAKGLDGGKKKGYWSLETELGARAFQSYILDRLEAQDRRNDYLTRPQGSPEDYKDASGDPYPRGIERAKINAAFDVLVNSLKTKETESGTMVYDAPENAPPFYSKLERDVEAKMGKSATVEQVRALLRDQKADEVEWTGISDFLEGKSTVTKAEVLDYLRANRLEIKEVMKGGASAESEAGEARVRIDDIEREMAKADKFLSYENDDYSSEVLINGSNAARNAVNLTDEQNALVKEYQKLHEKLYAMDEGDGDNTKFSDYTLPGGQNYRELLLTMPGGEKIGSFGDWLGKRLGVSALEAEGRKEYDDDALHDQFMKEEAASKNSFHSSHFDEPNILAHVRFNDRVDEAGRRVLFLEEIQSDWHQKGRREGYRSAEGLTATENKRYQLLKETAIEDGFESLSREQQDEILALQAKAGVGESGVPDAPFKKTWHEFALKRMIRYAAQNGYDAIAWTTGEQQAERYDLSKQVDEVRAAKQKNGNYQIVLNKGDRAVLVKTDIPVEGLAEIVGKDLAAKIVSAPKHEPLAPFEVRRADKIRKSDHSTRSKEDQAELDALNLRDQGVTSFTGVDLKVGGEGMKGFYDKIVPSFLNKLGKKYGAQVGETKVKTDEADFQAVRPDGSPYSLQQFDSEAEAKEFVNGRDGWKVRKNPSAGAGVHSFPITDALRDTAMREGFTVYDRPSDEEAKAYGPGVDMKYVAKQIEMDLDYGGEVSKEIKKTGKTDYVGKPFKSWQDAAEIVACMRHTMLEHFHFIFVKNGKVVGNRIITSGRPNAVKITFMQKMEMRAMAEKLGADEIYSGHNHPSGNPDPSIPDREMNSDLQWVLGKKYKGQVVTDHDEFSVIGSFGDKNTVDRLKFENPQEKFYTPKTGPLSYSSQMAAMASKDATLGKSNSIIYLDARRQVIAIEDIAVGENVPASVKAGIVRNKASWAAIVVPKSSVKASDLPSEVINIIEIDKKGKTSTPFFPPQGRAVSAWGKEVSSEYVADEPTNPLPRYMGKNGMDAADFAKAIAEEKIGPGSIVTLRVKLEGIPKGTPGKVLAVGQSTQTLMVQFQGETVPRAVRAENLTETNRKPAARAEVEMAEKAAKTSGQPSKPVKRIISEGQAGTARPAPTVTEGAALKGSLEAEARGAKTADALARKEMRAKMREQERAARAELASAQKNLRHAVMEAQTNGRWEAATRAKVVEFAKAFLPPSERGALLSRVLGAKTNNDLLEAFAYIDQKANLYANKKAMNDVRVLVKRVQSSKSFPIGIKLQIEELISDIRLENWTGATLDKVAAQQALIAAAQEAGADVDVPQAVLDQIAKLTKRPLAELDGTELADILADLRFMVERGREVKAMSAELKEMDREEALADLVAGTKKVYVKPTTSKGEKRAFGGPALDWAQQAKNRWLGRADMAQAAGIYLRPIQAIMDDLDGTFLGGGPNRREWERLQSAYVDSKAYSMRKNEAFAAALRQIGPLTQQEIDRVWIVGFREMHDVRPHLHKMGLGDDEIDAVKLTPKENMLLGAMRAPFQGQEELSKLTMVTALLNNTKFVQVDNYLPIKTKYVPSNPNTSAKEILANEVAVRRKSPDRGMLIERVSGAAREFRTDLGVIEDAIDGQAALMHMAIPLLRAHSIFTDPAYEAAAGDAAVDFWRDYIDALARNGAFPKSKVERVLSKAMSNLGTAALAFKPNVALMQLSSLGPGSTIVGGGYVKRAMFAGPEWDGFVDSNMPLVKGRQGGDPAVRDVMHGGLLPKVAEAGFKPMVAGDHWTAAQVALGAYFQFMERAGMPADPQKPYPPALRYAQSVTGRTMASPWLIDMPMALSRGGAVVKGALQFQGETLAKFALMKDLGADAGENTARSSAAAGYLGAALLYEAGVRWGWRALVMAALYGIGAVDKKQYDRFLDKDNGYWKQVVASAANGIPFVGAVADAIMYDAGPIPVVNTSVDALAGIGNGVVGAINGKPIAMMKGIVQGMTAIASLSGVPGAGVVGWIAKQPLRGRSDKKKSGGYKP